MIEPASPDDAIATAAQLESFIVRFLPEVAELTRACRAALRTRLPNALELVYDNYQFLAIGFGTSERAADWMVSLAVGAKGVSLSFFRGTSIPDPDGILQGSGNQNRFVRLAGPETLAEPAVEHAIAAAIALTSSPMPDTPGRTIIKSISAKQRPRRPVTKDPA